MQTVFGVIAPHPPIMLESVGGERSHKTNASVEAMGVVRAALADFAPETLVLISPHAAGFTDAFAVYAADWYSGDLSLFGDQRPYRWRGDSALAEEIRRELRIAGTPCAPQMPDGSVTSGPLDHATIVPLSFLDPESSFALVLLALSGLSYAAHWSLGEAVRSAAQNLGRKTAFIASGDLSHRLTRDAPAGYSPSGQALDDAIIQCVTDGRFEDLALIDPAVVREGGECGLRSFVALGGYCGQRTVPSRVLAYEGPWGVGYLTAVVGDAAVEAIEDVRAVTEDAGRKGGSAGDDESEIVRLARQSIQRKILTSESLAHPVLSDPVYPTTAGAFVSIHQYGQLRGCIGTVLPTKDSLAQEVADNAVEAALHDPRFPPITTEELESLEIKVDVLHAPESCSIDDLDPSRYGVVVTSGWRRGLLLPDLEGVEDVMKQVEIAMSKGNIHAGEPCSFERFRVDRYT